ncbi:uncharacterized protein LOC126904521 [Daktulosphaira vitifoliae]|uniref:uncharacterized protein LOC126904521 n=1 Tax=Daktulosphaira vitifoliae TaxID=58002 RepID=UPI0021AA9FFA|nr:uncharacterized protein LOC126904521 [Daktulosphaira vitifoliae]
MVNTKYIACTFLYLLVLPTPNFANVSSGIQNGEIQNEACGNPEIELVPGVKLDGVVPNSVALLPNIGSNLPAGIASETELLKILSTEALISDLPPITLVNIIFYLASSTTLLSNIPSPCIVNLIITLTKAPKLLCSLTQPALYALLAVITSNPGNITHVPLPILAKFITLLLSTSPGTLYSAPTSTLAILIGQVTSPIILSALPHNALLNLITLLSLNVGLFNALPISTIVSLLTYLSTSPSILTALPPSTLFDFLENLFDTFADSTPFLVNVVPTAILAKILSTVLTPCILTVLPTKTFNLLLCVLGSAPALLGALPTCTIVSLLTVLASSPNILVDITPTFLVNILVQIVTYPNLLTAIPLQLIIALLNAVATYLPTALNAIPPFVLNTLLGCGIPA